MHKSVCVAKWLQHMTPSQWHIIWKRWFESRWCQGSYFTFFFSKWILSSVRWPTLKGVLYILPKISMFCALSQNYQHLEKKIIYASYSKLSKKLQKGIEILVGQAVFKLWIKTFKKLFGSITQEPAWPTWTLVLILSSLDNLLLDAYIIFQKCVDNFEIEHRTC